MTASRPMGLGTGAGDKARTGLATQGPKCSLGDGYSFCLHQRQTGSAQTFLLPTDRNGEQREVRFVCDHSLWRREKKQIKGREAKYRARRCLR